MFTYGTGRPDFSSENGSAAPFAHSLRTLQPFCGARTGRSGVRFARCGIARAARARDSSGGAHLHGDGARLLRRLRGFDREDVLDRGGAERRSEQREHAGNGGAARRHRRHRRALQEVRGLSAHYAARRALRNFVSSETAHAALRWHGGFESPETHHAETRREAQEREEERDKLHFLRDFVPPAEFLERGRSRRGAHGC